MIREQDHIIGRLQLAVEVDSRGGAAFAFDHTERIQRLFLEKIGPIFDTYAPSEELLRFDKLVINVGEIDQKEFSQVLVDKLAAELKIILQNTAEQQSERQVISTAKASAEALDYYLQKGRLPWSESRAEWTKGVEQQLFALSPEMQRLYLEKWVASHRTFTRLRQQLSTAGLVKINQLLWYTYWSRVRIVLQAITRLHDRAPLLAPAAFAHLLYGTTLELYAKNLGKQAQQWPQLSALLWSALAPQIGIPVGVLVAHFRQLSMAHKALQDVALSLPAAPSTNGGASVDVIADKLFSELSLLFEQEVTQKTFPILVRQLSSSQRREARVIIRNWLRWLKQQSHALAKITFVAPDLILQLLLPPAHFKALEAALSTPLLRRREERLVALDYLSVPGTDLPATKEDWQVVLNPEEMLFASTAPLGLEIEVVTTPQDHPSPDAWQVLDYFLTNGYLLYNEKINSQAALEAWLCAQVESSGPYQRVVLKKHLRTERQRKRLFKQFGPGTQWAVNFLLADIAPADLRFSINYLQAVLPLLFPSLSNPGPALLAASIEFWLQDELPSQDKETAFLGHLLMPFWEHLPLSKTSVLEQLVLITSYEEWQRLPAEPLVGLQARLGTLLAEQLTTEDVTVPPQLDDWLAGKQNLDSTLENQLLSMNAEQQAVLLTRLQATRRSGIWAEITDRLVLVLLPTAANNHWPTWKLVLDDLFILHWEGNFYQKTVEQWLALIRKDLLQLLLQHRSAPVPVKVFWQHWLAQASSHSKAATSAVEATYAQLAAAPVQAGLLRSALVPLLSVPAATTVVASTVNPLSSEEQALLYFLEHGRHFEQRVLAKSRMQTIFEQLIAQQPERVRMWLRKLPSPLNIADRLNDHFPQSTIHQLLADVLSEQYSGQGKAVLDRLWHWVKNTVGRSVPETYVLGIAVDYSRDKAPVVLDDGAFLRYFLQRLQRSFSISERELRHYLLRLEEDDVPGALKQAVGVLLRTLGPEEEAQVSRWLVNEQQKTREESGTVRELRTEQDAFFYWLRYGRDPWWKTSTEPATDFLNNVSPALAETDVRTLLRAHWPLPGAQQRLSEQLSVAGRAALLRLFLGEYTPFALVCLETGHVALRETGQSYPLAWYWREMLALALRTSDFASIDFVRQWLGRLARRSGSALGPFYQQVAQYLVSQTGNYHLRLAEIVAEVITEDATLSSDGGAEKKESSTSESLPETVREDATLSSDAGAEKEDSSTSESLADTKRPDPSENALPLSPREQLQEEISSVRYYLRYGSLPPRLHFWSRKRIWEAFQQLLDAHPALLRQALRDLLPLPAVVDRILNATSVTVWRRLAFIYLDQQIEAVNGLQKDWEQIRGGLGPSVAAQDRERTYYRALILHLGQRAQQPFQLVAFARVLLKELSNTLGQAESELLLLLQDRIEISPEGSYPALTALLPALQLQLRTQKRRDAEKKMTDQDRAEQPSIDQAIYIHNAGLVILAPFFKRFFDTLNMTEGKGFTDVENTIRAVHLLQYMATGQTETAEHLLVFNKILTGLPVNTPVPLSIDLTKEEDDLVDFLFRSVFQNWEMMKNSTKENLRGSFLLRDGRLVEEEDRWVLTVESKSYDIVLDYLPWTISVLQLPWMEKRMEVDWKTKA